MEKKNIFKIRLIDYIFKTSFFFFFARWVSTGTPGFRPAGPLPHTSHLNSYGLFRSPAPLLRATILLSLASFICSGSILAKPKVCILTFSNTGHSHRMCTDVSFSTPHLLHEGVCSPHLVQHVPQIDMPV